MACKVCPLSKKQIEDLIKQNNSLRNTLNTIIEEDKLRAQRLRELTEKVKTLSIENKKLRSQVPRPFKGIKPYSQLKRSGKKLRRKTYKRLIGNQIEEIKDVAYAQVNV